MSTIYNIIPLGFRFLPSDDEIITYLLYKIPGTPLPSLDGLMFETDVFGDSPPWELFDSSSASDAINGDNNVRYFFTQLKKKSKNGSKNFKRSVGEIGTWKGETKAVEIKDPNTQLTIGEKRNFTFKPNRVSSGKRKRSEDDHGDDFKWLMTEYGLAGETLNYKKFDSDYVLCRIKKKKVKSQEEEDEVLQSDANNNVASNIYLPQLKNDPTINYPLQFKNDPMIYINSSGYENNYCNPETSYRQVRVIGGEFDGDNSEYVGNNINNDIYVNKAGCEEECSMRQDSAQPWNMESFSDEFRESMEDVESIDRLCPNNYLI